MTFERGFNVLVHLKSVRHLVLVAAPSCCGKTHFLKCLSQQTPPILAEALGFGSVSGWRAVDAYELPAIRDQHIDKLIVCYAIPTDEILSGKIAAYGDDPRLAISNIAREISFITLVEGARTLTSRLKKRRVTTIIGSLSSPRYALLEWQRLTALSPAYRDPMKLEQVYRWWFEYSQSFASQNNWVVTSQNIGLQLSVNLERLPATLRHFRVDGAGWYVVCTGNIWNALFRSLNLHSRRAAQVSE